MLMPMTLHTASISWTRSETPFQYETYSRDHTVSFGTERFIGSAAEDYFGNPDAVDPEQMLIASISSCHMLTFLAIAAKKKFTIDSYQDAPSGTLEKNDNGKMALTKIVLAPTIQFSGEKTPTPEQVQRLHDSAHRHCFIANSITAEVVVRTTK